MVPWLFVTVCFVHFDSFVQTKLIKEYLEAKVFECDATTLLTVPSLSVRASSLWCRYLLVHW